MNRVAIVGSRDYEVLARVRRFVRDLPSDTIVISGGARGVDRTAEEAARSVRLEVVVFEPDWDLGRVAGLLRNKKIVAEADEIVAYWDGKSRGTAHTVGLALKAGKPVRVFGPDGVLVDPETCAASRRGR